jgi:hypothetical protein
MIEAAGFTTEYSWDSFRHYARDYAGLYGTRVRNRIGIIREALEKAEFRLSHRRTHVLENADEVARLTAKLEAFWERWLGDWGYGTMIWVSTNAPQTYFGDACFEVRKPRGAKDLIKDTLWYIPMPFIPSESFRRVS